MSWGVLVLCTLGSYRLARLVTTDELTEPLRHWTLVRFPPRRGEIEDDLGRPLPGTARLVPSLPVTLVNCTWCVGVWTTLLLVVVAHLIGVLPLWQLVLLGWPAGSTVVGLISRLEA